MGLSQTRLTHADVERLGRASSVRTRADVASKVASDFAHGYLGGREKDIAMEIFRLLARDAEVRVRETLSQQLQSCSELPHDVALTLAHDVEQVSVPILEFSNVLSDEDLLEVIAATREVAKLTAVARREVVAAPVSHALMRVNDEKVTRALIQNKGADLPEDGLLHTITVMASRESVIDALMERGGLPVVCMEKIFMTVSTAMKKRLIERYQVSRHLIEGRLEYAREMNTLGVAGRSDDVNVEALVRHMRKQRKLTSSVVIRALCVGDMRFFEHAMSELTDIPVTNVRRLMLDAGEQGFQSLYRLSPLPPAYYPAVRTLLEISLSLTKNGRERPENFAARAIDKIESEGYDASVEYMPLLLTIIKGNAGEFPRIQ